MTALLSNKAEGNCAPCSCFVFWRRHC